VRLGGWEIAIVVVAILLLFGAKRLPELARAVGRSLREFKRGAREITDEIENARDEAEKATKDEEKAG